jgi:hypothetical protein
VGSAGLVGADGPDEVGDGGLGKAVRGGGSGAVATVLTLGPLDGRLSAVGAAIEAGG